MKRVLSLVLALALVLGSIPAGFAADTQTAGEVLKGYGVLQGDANGNLNETQTIDRATMYTILIKLLGKDAEAKAYTVPSTFTDDNTNWAANYIAFAEKEGLTKGVGNGLFSPNGKVTLQQMATIMLRALGYEADYNTAIADATAQGLLKSVVESENNGVVVKSDVYTSMLNTLSAPVKDSTELLGNVLKITGFTAVNAGPVAVSTIAPASAKTIKVTFASAVADTTKAVFTVKKGSTAVAVTTTWNEAKTEATLTAASNFAEATYAVNVAYDTKDLSSKEIAFTAQKVAKIEFTSSAVAVKVSSNIGYVTYKVLDQYNNDVTNTAMANSLSYQVGLSSASAAIKNGLMTITGSAAATDTQLVSLPSLSVVLYDSSSGVTGTKSLPISTVVGTLTDFQLGSADGIKLVEGDTTSAFYIPYTAKDMSGNETKSYDLITGGLIDADGTASSDVTLVVSLSNNITAKVVKDPSNSKNAAIEVKYYGTSNNSMDMPVTITAMTYGGKSSSINTTLAKAKSVEKIVLMAPAETVAVGETPEIPFEAYDAAGNLVKDYSYFDSTLEVNPSGFRIVENADGTAKFVMNTAVKGTTTLNATAVKSGKVSNLLTINVQDAAYPASLTFVQSGIIPAMEHTAIQTIEIGPDLAVYDQYDRKMSDSKINTAIANGYKLTVSTSNDKVGLFNTALTSTTNPNNSYDVGEEVSYVAATPTVAAYYSKLLTSAADVKIFANAATGSSSTVTFTLQKSNNAVLDTASTSISVVKTTDISSYTIAKPSAAIYAIDTDGSRTDREGEYAYLPKVYGATTAGTKVLLTGKPVVATSVSNTTDFIITSDTAALAYNGVYVNAVDFNSTPSTNRTAATTEVVVTVEHNYVVKSLSATVTSSSTAPVAKDIVLECDDEDVAENVAAGYYMVQLYNPSTGAETASPFYFQIDDSYDTNGMVFKSFKIGKAVTTSTGVITTHASTIDNQGSLNVSAADTGKTLYLTAVTNNGLSATMKIEVQ